MTALAVPKTQAIRPTADRLRETLFNVLAHAYGDPVGGARVLDLFAGTGALGLEAISRGADFALFVDNGGQARALLREMERTPNSGQCNHGRPSYVELGLGDIERLFGRK